MEDGEFLILYEQIWWPIQVIFVDDKRSELESLVVLNAI